MSVEESLQGFIWSSQPMQQHKETEEPEENTEGKSEDQGSDEYSLASGFLKDVQDDHRSIVEQYVNKWDAGVQRRFQDLHSELNPYKELGSFEEIQQMAAIIEILNNEPERVYQALKEQLEPEAQKPVEQTPPEVPGLPPEYLDRLNKVDKLEATLQQIAEMMVSNDQQQKAAQEDQELEQYMKNLHTEFGDFNDKYVLTQMYHGASADDAVKEWNSIIQERINGAAQETDGLPPVLSSQGGGAVPAEAQSLGKIPSKDVQKFVAEMLQQTHQS